MGAGCDLDDCPWVQFEEAERYVIASQNPAKAGWIVVDTARGVPVFMGTEPEACIVAFALSTVAKGRPLASWEENGDLNEYEGPTDGVAP